MGMGVSNLLQVLQLPKFPHFEGERGDGGPAVDGLTRSISPYVQLEEIF
jgi:hypothetical protein